MKNYLKNKKTKLTNLLYTSQDIAHEDNRIELVLWKDGDVDDYAKAQWYTGGYIDLDRLNNQINELVCKYKFEKIELKYPDGTDDFDYYLIFENKLNTRTNDTQTNPIH